ncbi:unnamed protein product, partial [Ectocarpus sp. 8 AP-2014]
CDPCSLAKRRCDGQPQCSLCRKKGLTCVYGEVSSCSRSTQNVG